MTTRNPDGALNAAEKSIVKRLLSDGKRNQDIQAFINLGRSHTVNSARLSEVKKDKAIIPATDEELQRFTWEKECYDPKTQLNSYSDERLVRAREAMLLAVGLFNNPVIQFRTEVFCVLANIAWTYLMHEFYIKNGKSIVKESGYTIELSAMLSEEDCPLSVPVKKNLAYIKKLRDAAEHSILGRTDEKMFSLFQACCLNFDEVIGELFQNSYRLSNNLNLALQFGKVDFSHIEQLQKYDLPEDIAAIEVAMNQDVDPEIRESDQFRFRIFYTKEFGTKASAHAIFSTNGDSTDAIHREVVKLVPDSNLYPYRPSDVVDEVKKVHRQFTMTGHTKAWKRFKVRPSNGSSNKEGTDRNYCFYSEPFQGYLYSRKWVDRLIEHCAKS